MRAARKIYSSAAVVAVAAASWSATALAAVQSRTYVDPNPKFFDAHPVWGTVVTIYIAVAGFTVLPMIRRPLLRWYRSQIWFVSGKDPIDVLLRQIGMRVSVEASAFMVACFVGALGGWIYVVMRSGARAPATVRAAD